jgi:hypothetical protein
MVSAASCESEQPAGTTASASNGTNSGGTVLVPTHTDLYLNKPAASICSCKSRPWGEKHQGCHRLSRASIEFGSLKKI